MPFLLFAYVGLPNTCFSARLTVGKQQFSGVAGLMAEGMTHPLIEIVNSFLGMNLVLLSRSGFLLG